MRAMFFPLILVAVVVAAPAYENFEESDKFVFTPDFYSDDAIFYEGDLDIVDIVVPLNAVSDIEKGKNLKNMLIFFVEGDIREDGSIDYQGISVYKDGGLYDLLENGRAVAASTDGSSSVFLGGKDGLYLYDPESISVERYGDFKHSIKDMAKENDNDVIYILTTDGEAYKVYDEGRQKEKVNELDGAEQIVMDYDNNLFFYGADKQPFVRRNDGEILKIEGLPISSDARLLRPMLLNDGVGFLAANELHSLYPNGKSKPQNQVFAPDARPTAYSMESVVFKYLAYNKKVYEFSLFPEKDEDAYDEDASDDEEDVEEKEDEKEEEKEQVEKEEKKE